jgi:hypothetical protein
MQARYCVADAVTCQQLYAGCCQQDTTVKCNTSQAQESLNTTRRPSNNKASPGTSIIDRTSFPQMDNSLSRNLL